MIRDIMLCSVIFITTIGKAQDRATFLERSTLPSKYTPVRMVASDVGTIAGIVNLASTHDVLLKKDGVYHSMMMEVPLPPSLIERKISSVAIRDDGKIVVGMKGAVASRYPDDAVWKIDSVTHIRRRTFVGTCPNGDSCLLIVTADSILEETIVNGIPFTRVKRDWEIWSHKDTGLTQLFVFPADESNVRAMFVQPVVVNGDFYIPFLNRFASEDSELLRIGQKGLEFLQTPTHSTLHYKEASAIVVTPDRKIQVVYQGGGTPVHTIVPNAILTIDPSSKMATISDNWLDWRGVNSAATIGNVLAIGTDAGLVLGVAGAFQTVDFRQWFTPPLPVNEQVQSLVSTSRGIVISTPDGMVEADAPILSVQEFHSLPRISTVVIATDENIHLENGPWLIYNVHGNLVRSTVGLEINSTILSVAGVYVLTNGSSVIRALVISR